MKERYITLVGMDHYYGMKPFSIGKRIRCIKERDNEFDSEAIKAVMKEIGTVAYVANSPRTVITGCMSAGRLYDRVQNTFFVQVKFMTNNRIICEVCGEMYDEDDYEEIEDDDKTEEMNETSEYKYELLDGHGSWLFIKEESSYDEPDGFIHMMKKVKEHVDGEIIALGNDEYLIEGDEMGLIYQWDSCFGITIVCPNNRSRKKAIDFLVKAGILDE